MPNSMRPTDPVKAGDLLLATNERVCHVERVERDEQGERIHALCEGERVELRREEILLFDASVWIRTRAVGRAG